MSLARKLFHLILVFVFLLSILDIPEVKASESRKETPSEQKIYLPIFTSQGSHYAVFKMISAAFQRGEVTVLDFPNFKIIKTEDENESGGFELKYTAISKSSGKKIEIAKALVDQSGSIKSLENLIQLESLEALEDLLAKPSTKKANTETLLTTAEYNTLFEGAFPPPKPFYYRVLKSAWTILGLGALMAWVWFDPVSKILLGLIGAGTIANSILAAAGFAGMMIIRGVIFVEIFGYIYHRFFQHLGFWTRRAGPIRISQRYHWKHHMILYPVGPSYIHESPYKGTEPGLGLTWVLPSIGTGIVSAVIMVAAAGLSLWSVIGAVVFIASASAYGAFIVSVSHARMHEKKHDLWYWSYFNWLSDIHMLHHWDQAYNYTIIHPAVDILFGTYLNPKTHPMELDIIKRMVASYEEDKDVTISDLRNWRYLLLEATPAQYAAFISNAKAHSKSLRKMDTLMRVLQNRLIAHSKDDLARILYHRGLKLLEGIGNDRSKKLVAEYQPFFDQLPGEGSAFQKSGEALTSRQDKLVDEAIRTYFDDAAAARYGFKNEKPAEAYAMLDADVYGKLDPDGKLSAGKTLIYVFDDLMFRMQRIASVNQVNIPWGLITHPSTRFGAKLYMDLEHLDALLQLPENARREWAAHEAEHLENPSASEDEIQKSAPVKTLIKEFKKYDRRKVSQYIKLLTKGDRLEKYLAMRNLRKYGKLAARAIPRIMEIAGDENEEKNNRLDAVDTLGVIGKDSAEVVRALVHLKELENPKTHLSKKILLVLENFSAGSEELLNVFKDVLMESIKDDMVRAGARVLSRAGKQADAARDILVEFLADKGNSSSFPKGYEEAVKSVGVLGVNTPASVRALFGALELRNRKINLAALAVLRGVPAGRADLIKVITEAAETSTRATARSFAVELLRRERELPAETLKVLERIGGNPKEQGFTRKLAKALVREGREEGAEGVVKPAVKARKAPFPQLVITRNARLKYDLQGPLYQLIDGPDDMRQIDYSHPGMEAWLRNQGFYRHELVWLGVLHEARHEAIRQINDQYELIDELKENLEAAFEGPQGLKNFLKSFYLEFPEPDLYQKILEAKAGEQEMEALAQSYLNKSKIPESAAAGQIDRALEDMLSRPGGIELGVEEILVRVLEARNQNLRNHPLLESSFYESRAFRTASEAIQLYFKGAASKGVILGQGHFAGQALGLGLLEFAGTENIENISIRDQLRNAHRAGFNLRGTDASKVKMSGKSGQALVSGKTGQLAVNRENPLVENADQARDIISAAEEWTNALTRTLPQGALTLAINDAGIQAESGESSRPLVNQVLKEWLDQLGLDHLVLPQRNNVTAKETLDLFNWLALAVSVSKSDVFSGKKFDLKEKFQSRIAQREKQAKEMNVKALTLAQIEQDFLDAATRDMMNKELESGVRYVLIADKGQNEEDIREKLARSHFDFKWLQDGKIIILNEFDPQTRSLDVDSVISLTIKTLGLDEKSFKAYIQDPENTEEASNFALAVPENMKLTGNVTKVRYFRARKGVRLTETLTFLHGLLTAPLKVVVQQMKEELLANGFSQEDIDELLSMDGDVLIPPIQSGSLVNRMVEEKKAAEMISWSA